MLEANFSCFLLLEDRNRPLKSLTLWNKWRNDYKVTDFTFIEAVIGQLSM